MLNENLSNKAKSLDIGLYDILKDDELRTSLEKIVKDNPAQFIHSILNPNTMVPSGFYSFHLSYIHKGLNSRNFSKDYLFERDSQNNYPISLGNFTTFGEAYDKMITFFGSVLPPNARNIIEEDETENNKPQNEGHNIRYKITQIYGTGKKYLSFSYSVTISIDYNYIDSDKKIKWYTEDDKNELLCFESSGGN